jgi:type IV pilus assembly protein PilO
VSRRDRNVLILGLLGIVFLIVGYYFLILSPLLNRLDERAQERSDKESQLANLQQEVAQLEAVRREAPEIQRQLLELSKRIPTQPEIPTLVVQIEEIADASGVTQLRIDPGTPGPPPGGGDFSVVPITMSFNGT